jgi:surfactin synthase thioesterase subunit
MGGWLRHWAAPLVPRVRLLALPPAGGAAHLFRPWTPHLPLDVELVAAELPGHGGRLGEAPLGTMDALVDGLVPEIRALPPVPTAVLGHSMGAIVALALCRRLRRLDPSWRPEMLFVVGSEGRRSRRAARPLIDAPAAALREFLLDAHWSPAGATPDPVADTALQDLVMPALRADLALLAVAGSPDEPPLGCPVRVLAGTADPFVAAADRLDWAGESDGDFAIRLFAGGHFFYAEPALAAAFLASVSADLNRLAARAPA